MENRNKIWRFLLNVGCKKQASCQSREFPVIFLPATRYVTRFKIMEMRFCCLLLFSFSFFAIASRRQQIWDTRGSFPSRCSICCFQWNEESSSINDGLIGFYFKKRRRIKETRKKMIIHTTAQLSLSFFLSFFLFTFSFLTECAQELKNWTLDGMASAAVVNCMDVCSPYGGEEKGKGVTMDLRDFDRWKGGHFLLPSLFASRRNRKNTIKRERCKERKKESKSLA